MPLITEPLTEAAAEKGRVRVWDAFVRIFHWGVVISFFLAYFTEDELLTVHVWAGYTIGALLALRIAWGFVGPKHARFNDFVTAPWTALRYFVDLLSGRAERHLGHSPAGGIMVLLLLAGLLATAWSGLELHAVENNAGPFAATATTAVGRASSDRSGSLLLLAAVHADENERAERYAKDDRDAEELWEEIHEVLANGVMALVVLHVLGVMLASVVHRENLVASMLTGWKRGDSRPPRS